MDNPCRECRERSPTCHGSCAPYLEYAEQFRARAAAERQGSQALDYERTRCKHMRGMRTMHIKRRGKKNL